MIQRIPGPEYDDNGDPIVPDDDPEPITMPGAFVAPTTTGDISDPGRVGVVVGLTLYAPRGDGLVHTDQVLVDEELYDIDGELAVWDHPMTGWQPGVTAQLRRAQG